MLSRQHAPRSGQERHQQIELAVGDWNRLALRRHEPAQPHVQLPAREAIGPDSGQSVGHRLVSARASQQGADTGEKLARRKRFGEVVVRAELQTHHPIGFFLAAGQDDDRNVRFGAQIASDLHPVLARQLQVEDEQVDRMARHDVGDRLPTGQGGNLDVVVTEVVGNHLPHRRVIVDCQDVNGRRRRSRHRVRFHELEISGQHRA